MTKKLNVVYPDVYEETAFAFEDTLKEAETGEQIAHMEPFHTRRKRDPVFCTHSLITCFAQHS
jgi:hypothetical protein